MPPLPGDPAPSLVARGHSNPNFAIDTAAGRYLLLGIVPPGHAPFLSQVQELLADTRDRFDDANLVFFGILGDPARWAAQTDSLPGVRWLLDEADEIGRGVSVDGGVAWSGWILVDPNFRVLFVLPSEQTGRLREVLSTLPPVAAHAGVELFAPVLIVPRVFELELCATLIQTFESHGGAPSGFMREVDGKTVGARDPSVKMRSDMFLPAGPLRDAVRARIHRRLVPQIAKAFNFTATRQERDLVACYDASAGGFFHAHRDNTTKGTAHRRFAVTINLNAHAFSGGDLRFPEFGPKTYRAPTGGAVVFSCSLLHEALPVTAGKRYAFLPFLYDEEAAAERERNAKFVGIDGYGYHA